jgi:chemotaxis protein CheX
MTTTIGHEELIRLTEEIWCSMLGMELTPVSEATITGRKVSACVQILGEWDGAVRLDLSADLARTAAAGFMCMEPSEVASDQIRDATGELANMTAGSVKTLLPKGCKLSLPSVADGSDFELTIHHGKAVLECRFICEHGTLILTLFEREP